MPIISWTTASDWLGCWPCASPHSWAGNLRQRSYQPWLWQLGREQRKPAITRAGEQAWASIQEGGGTSVVGLWEQACKTQCAHTSYLGVKKPCWGDLGTCWVTEPFPGSIHKYPQQTLLTDSSCIMLGHTWKSWNERLRAPSLSEHHLGVKHLFQLFYLHGDNPGPGSTEGHRGTDGCRGQTCQPWFHQTNLLWPVFDLAPPCTF